jgi:hypothetical protein
MPAGIWTTRWAIQDTVPRLSELDRTVTPW